MTFQLGDAVEYYDPADAQSVYGYIVPGGESLLGFMRWHEGRPSKAVGRVVVITLVPNDERIIRVYSDEALKALQKQRVYSFAHDSFFGY